jgi:hypothetical protein
MAGETSINSVLDDLTMLVQSGDERVAYWASSALNTLVMFRSIAANAGYVRPDLINKNLFKTDPTLWNAYLSLISNLEKFSAFLNEYSPSRLDTESALSVARIQSAVAQLATLKTRPLAHSCGERTRKV